MINQDALLHEINDIVNKNTKEQARKNRDYESLKDIHYRLKDGNPDVYKFFTLSFSSNDSYVFIQFNKDTIDKIEELRDLFFDDFTVFYDKNIENNIRSMGVILKEILRITKTWSVTLYSDIIALKDKNYRHISFEKEMIQLDEITTYFIKTYSELYFKAREVL